MDKSFANINTILLQPGLKKKFMKKAGYLVDIIETYVKKAEVCLQKEYDATQAYSYVDTLNVASADVFHI